MALKGIQRQHLHMGSIANCLVCIHRYKKRENLFQLVVKIQIFFNTFWSQIHEHCTGFGHIQTDTA